MSKYLDSNWLFQSAGNFIELDAWVPENVIEQIHALNADESNHLRTRSDDDKQGDKAYGVEWNHVPAGWDLPEGAVELGVLVYNKGDYLFPHRDKWRAVKPTGEITGDAMRLICFVNNTNVNEFAFLLDGEVKHFEPRRWYAVNTRLIHSGFCFKDDTYHLSCGIQFNEDKLEETTTWLLDKLPYAQPKDDVKGINCGRN